MSAAQILTFEVVTCRESTSNDRDPSGADDHSPRFDRREKPVEVVDVVEPVCRCDARTGGATVTAQVERVHSVAVLDELLREGGVARRVVLEAVRDDDDRFWRVLGTPVPRIELGAVARLDDLGGRARRRRWIGPHR